MGALTYSTRSAYDRRGLNTPGGIQVPRQDVSKLFRLADYVDGEGETGTGDTVHSTDLTDIDSIVNRLRRIEGQVRGLQRMVLEGRDCREQIIQVVALRSAVNQVGMALIARHVRCCAQDNLLSEDKLPGTMESLIDLLRKFC